MDLTKPTLPTVKPRQSLFEAYRSVFRAEMEKTGAFSAPEVEAMLAIACTGESGHLDLSRYHCALFDAYFKDRDFRWPEMDKWQAIGAKLGRWPNRWDAAERMSYVEAQSLGSDAIATKRRSTYVWLMDYIGSRASVVERRYAPHLKDMPSKIVLGIKQDREWHDLALAENPDALPPLFPSDVSIVRYSIPGFES